jgi:hypothetical protein
VVRASALIDGAKRVAQGDNLRRGENTDSNGDLMRVWTAMVFGLFALALAKQAQATVSAEMYTSSAHQYGRFSARIQFAPGSGVVSSFFLWKDGSEMDGVFWNELDIEKLESVCRVETNALYGDPEQGHSQRLESAADLCGQFHVYTYEWTPEYIAWTLDGAEIRRETGETATAFSQNATEGMQLRFNVWPGDNTFGGDFDPSILPVYEYIDWVEYSSYANGAFQVEWRDDFTDATLGSRWLTASWDSPKGLSTHAASNAGILDGYAVLALTPDQAPGIGGANPPPNDATPDPSSTSTVPTMPTGSAPDVPVSPSAEPTATTPSSTAPDVAPSTPEPSSTPGPAPETGGAPSVPDPAPSPGGSTAPAGTPAAPEATPAATPAAMPAATPAAMPGATPAGSVVPSANPASPAPSLSSSGPSVTPAIATDTGADDDKGGCELSRSGGKAPSGSTHRSILIAALALFVWRSARSGPQKRKAHQGLDLGGR